MIEQLSESIPIIIEQSGILAPILFILLHLIRPFLFLPVIFVCMVGGYLFGLFYGSLFSIIGLTLMSMIFYVLVAKFPNARLKFTKMNNKMLKNRSLTLSQLLVLRMVPFVHFHLLSLYIMEKTSSFNEYVKYSFLGMILPAFIYTSFGHMIMDLSLTSSIMLLVAVIIVLILVRRRSIAKETSIQWKNFFTH